MNEIERLKKEAEERRRKTALDVGGSAYQKLYEAEASLDSAIAKAELEAQENEALTEECNRLSKERDEARRIADQLAKVLVPYVYVDGEDYFPEALNAYDERSWK